MVREQDASLYRVISVSLQFDVIIFWFSGIYNNLGAWCIKFSPSFIFFVARQLLYYCLCNARGYMLYYILGQNG